MNLNDLPPYNLADSTLLSDNETPYRFLIWQPDNIYVIIGRSNKPDTSVFVDRAVEDGVKIRQRPTGGMAVVLSPRMLVISALTNGPTRLDSHKYFRAYNQKIVAGLESLGVRQLDCRGISDIVLNDRKIAGTSLYRNPKQVFYHAVINVAESTELLERYLRFPARVPDYRAGRSHQDFVTSLAAEGYRLADTDIQRQLAHEFALPPDLGGHQTIPGVDLFGRATASA